MIDGDTYLFWIQPEEPASTKKVEARVRWYNLNKPTIHGTVGCLDKGTNQGVIVSEDSTTKRNQYADYDFAVDVSRGLNNQESSFCALTILSGQFSGTGSGTAPEVPEDSILSKYYQFYTNLLNDQRLLTTAERLGFRINFIPHPTLFPYLDRFQILPQVNVCGTGVTYRESLHATNCW